jgi:hypothetical protein
VAYNEVFRSVSRFHLNGVIRDSRAGIGLAQKLLIWRLTHTSSPWAESVSSRSSCLYTQQVGGQQSLQAGGAASANWVMGTSSASIRSSCPMLSRLALCSSSAWGELDSEMVTVAGRFGCSEAMAGLHLMLSSAGPAQRASRSGDPHEYGNGGGILIADGGE